MSGSPTKGYRGDDSFRKFNLLYTPTIESNKHYDSGISIKSSEQDKSSTKVEISVRCVTGVFDLVAVRDLLNIVYPVYMYRGVLDGINLKC